MIFCALTPLSILILVVNLQAPLSVGLGALFLTLVGFYYAYKLHFKFKVGISKFYPVEINGNVNLLLNSIAMDQFNKWVEKERISKDMVANLICPYFEEKINKKEKFSFKSFLYITVPSITITFPFFLTNIAVTVAFRDAFNEDEVSTLMNDILLVYFTILFPFLFIGYLFFDQFSPARSEQHYRRVYQVIKLYMLDNSTDINKPKSGLIHSASSKEIEYFAGRNNSNNKG